jgi:hypothetical protein
MLPHITHRLFTDPLIYIMSFMTPPQTLQQGIKRRLIYDPSFRQPLLFTNLLDIVLPAQLLRQESMRPTLAHQMRFTQIERFRFPFFFVWLLESWFRDDSSTSSANVARGQVIGLDV